MRYAFRDKFEGKLTVFWMDTHDEIFFNPVTFVNENYPKTRRQGFELSARVMPLPWLSFWGNYGYMKPILLGDIFDGNDIPGVPRNKGSLGADLEALKGLLFSLKANFVGTSYPISDFSNQVPKVDGYYTLDARLSYNWKGLTAFFGVNNITDQKYSEWVVTNATGSRVLYYPSPGINYVGGISYSF